MSNFARLLFGLASPFRRYQGQRIVATPWSYRVRPLEQYAKCRSRHCQHVQVDASSEQLLFKMGRYICDNELLHLYLFLINVLIHTYLCMLIDDRGWSKNSDLYCLVPKTGGSGWSLH